MKFEGLTLVNTTYWYVRTQRYYAPIIGNSIYSKIEVFKTTDVIFSSNRKYASQKTMRLVRQIHEMK